MYTGFWWGYLKERNHLEDLVVDGRIILNESSRSAVEEFPRIVLAQDRNKWRALGNAIMNLRVSYNAGNFLSSFSGRTLLRELNEKLDACG